MMKRLPSDWLLRLAWACPIVIVACMLIGWRLSNRLYTDVDGAFARWNFEYAFEWGHWFDLAIFHPFAGLGFRLIKSTIQGLRPGRQMRGSFALACRSELRYGGSPSTC